MRNFGWGRSLTLGGAVAALLVIAAQGAAADGPRPYVIGATDLQGQTDWTGFYIGGKLGGAWSDISWSEDANLFSGGLPGASADFSPSGFAGGVIAGGNLQTGHWVFGAELSYSGVDLSQTVVSPLFPATDVFSTQVDWLGTIEGRIGYSWDHVLIFGKGGWVGSNAKLQLVRNSTGQTATTDKFVDGWTIGGGVEFLTWGSVVLGIEYDHTTLDLSDAPDCPLCIAGVPIFTGPQTVAGEANIDSVMVRASYLFRPED